jgi:hypothetical protein
MGLALIALLVVSMVAMIAAPVIARPVKANQIMVTVKHADGTPVTKTNVYIDQTGTGALTYEISTKGNGVVVFSLNQDTFTPGWNVDYPFAVYVYHNGVGYVRFVTYNFNSDFSSSINIAVSW